jgi:hypothetical protein
VSFSRAIQSLKRTSSRRVRRAGRLEDDRLLSAEMQYFQRNDWAGKVAPPTARRSSTPRQQRDGALPAQHALPARADARSQRAAADVQAELYRANDIENYDTAAVRVTVEGGAELLFYTSHSVPIAMGPCCATSLSGAKIYYEAGDRRRFIARFRQWLDPPLRRPQRRSPAEDLAVHRRGPHGRGRSPAACPAAFRTPCASPSRGDRCHRAGLPRDLVSRSRVCPDKPMKCVTGLASALVQCYDQAMPPRRAPWPSLGPTRGERIDLTQSDWQLERLAQAVTPP